MFPESEGLRPLDRRWHEAAQRYKETVFGLEDISPIDIQRFDLDEQHRRPRGAENPTTWLYEKPLILVNKSDRGQRMRDPRASPLIRDAEPDAIDEVLTDG